MKKNWSISLLKKSVFVFCMVYSPGLGHYGLQDRKEYASLSHSCHRVMAMTEMLCDTVVGNCTIWTMASVPHRDLASCKASPVPKCQGWRIFKIITCKTTSHHAIIPNHPTIKQFKSRIDTCQNYDYPSTRNNTDLYKVSIWRGAGYNVAPLTRPLGYLFTTAAHCDAVEKYMKTYLDNLWSNKGQNCYNLSKHQHKS